MSRERSRGWTVTWHTNESWTETRINSALKALTKDATVMYTCHQWEQGEQTGAKHVQGYIYFKNAREMAAVKRKLGETVHLEAAKGSAKQNRAYCSKDETAIAGTFKEHGNLPTQGQRSDLTKVAKTIKEHGLEAAVEEHPSKFIQYHGGMKALATHYQLQQVPHSRPVTVIVLYQYGSGAGKTHWATNYDEPEHTWNAGNNLPSLFNYKGQRTVIIDEMDGSRMKYNEAKQFLDKLVKSWASGYQGSLPGVWTTVIITSNSAPWTWYKEDAWPMAPGMPPSPLSRRCTKVYRLEGNYEQGNVKWWDESTPGSAEAVPEPRGLLTCPVSSDPEATRPTRPEPSPENGKDEESESEDKSDTPAEAESTPPNRPSGATAETVYLDDSGDEEDLQAQLQGYYGGYGGRFLDLEALQDVEGDSEDEW